MIEALLGASLIALIALASMAVYVWRRPLDMSKGGLRHLRKGLALACFSSILLVGVNTLWLVAKTTGFESLYGLLAAVGNLSNAASLLYGLRELTEESVFAGLLIVFAQLLWILFGIVVMTSTGYC
jgi:hypothetical protein